MQAGSWVVEETVEGCTSTSKIIDLYFLLDEYPGEFHWSVIDKCNGDAIVDFVEDGHYRGSGLHYHEEVCVPPGRYQLIIYDTAADGLCCYYGMGAFLGVHYDGSGNLWSTPFYGADETSPEFGDACGTFIPPTTSAGGSFVTNTETCTEHEERHGAKPLWGLCKFGWSALPSISILLRKLIVAEKRSCFLSHFVFSSCRWRRRRVAVC